MSSTSSLHNNDSSTQYGLPLSHTVYLVRHGEVNVASNICYGQLNCALTASFKHDLHRMCEFFKAKKLNNRIEVITSPLTRCAALAAGIAEELTSFNIQKIQSNTDKVTLIQQSAFQEMHFGQWEGQTWEAIGQENIEAWSSRLLDYTFPEGESARQFHARVIAQWQQLNQQLAQCQQAKTIIIVCHAGVVRSILADFLKMPLEHALTLQIDKLSVSTIKCVPTQTALSRCVGINQPINQ